MLLHRTTHAPDQPWEIRCYVKERRNDFEKWHAGLSVTGKARLAITLKYLCVRAESDWQRPHASTAGDHLGVIRFKDENRTQHRLTGYFDLAHHAFVICVAGIEKDGVYAPPDYEKRASACRESVGQYFDKRTSPWPWPFR